MDTLLRDFRYGIRTLLKNPAFTLVIITTLALGIGANTAMFNVVNAVLLQPLPYKDSSRLVALWTTQDGQRGSTAFPDFREIRQQNRSFDSVAAYTRHLVNVTGTQYAQRFRTLVVSPEFLATLGIQPRLGRDFRAEEGEYGTNDHVVIITDGMWRSSFGADPQIIGRNITVDAEPYTIVGVLPPNFWFLDFTDQLILPLVVPPSLDNRGNHYLNMIGRLRSGVPQEIAAGDLARIAKATAEDYSLNKGVEFHVALLQEEVTRNVRYAVLVLMSAVGFVLLIACGNLASLFVERSVVRRKEIAVRTALGATTGDLLRQFLTESMLLSAFGGAMGVFFAFFIARLIHSVSVATLPRAGQVHIDLAVLLFALAASLFTASIFGVIPIVHISQAKIHQALKESGHGLGESAGQNRLRAGLVIGEVALALVLLAGAGLMIKSVQLLRTVDSGFDDKNVLVFTVSLPAEKYSDAKLTWFPAATERANQFLQEAVERIGRLHGVRAAGATTTLPLSGISWDKVVTFYDRPLPSSVAQLPQIEYRPVVGDYFRALGIRLMSGRVFDAHDNLQSEPVAVVNEELVRRYMNGQNPIGKVLAVNPPKALLPASRLASDYPTEPEKFTIVGVVGNARYGSLQQDAGPMVYAPYAQNAESNVVMSFVIRTDSDPSTVIPGVRQQIAELDKDLPLGAMTTMGQVVSNQIATPLIEMFVLGAFGGLALLLASVGVYGVMLYSIAQRTREIGIRMALGAKPAHVMQMVMRHGATLTLLGLLIGFAGALMLTRVMKSMIYGTTATDHGVFIGTCALLAATAAIAMFFPAHRATKIDPAVALRNE